MLLDAFSGGFEWGKIAFESIIIIKIYPALSVAIGGRDEMDGSRHLWMTHSIYITCHHSRRLGVVLVVGPGDTGLFSWIYIYIN